MVQRHIYQAEISDAAGTWHARGRGYAKGATDSPLGSIEAKTTALASMIFMRPSYSAGSRWAAWLVTCPGHLRYRRPCSRVK